MTPLLLFIALCLVIVAGLIRLYIISISISTVLAYGYRYGDSWLSTLFPGPILLQPGDNAFNGHIACFGLPGTGKSSAISYQILQDIKAGRPFLLIDTHSDLYEQTLSLLIAHRYQPESIILIDPADQRWGSVGLNVLETAPGEVPYEVIDELIGGFKAIWRDSWGSRMEDILRNTFLTLQATGLTLGDAELFLTDPTFHSAVVGRLAPGEIKTYWLHHFGELKPAEQRFFIESSRNRFAALLGHPALRAVFSQPHSTIDFRRALNERRVILVNLSRNHLKESRGLFGALLLAKLTMAILARESIPPKQRTPITFYLDEAHEYFLPEFCLLLATGARKFGVSARFFTQSLSQFQPEHADVLLGSCATLMSFAVSRKDAERLGKELSTFSGNVIKNQEPGRSPQYYSIQELAEGIITTLSTQGVGTCLTRTRGPGQDGIPYVGTVPWVAVPAVAQNTVDWYKQTIAGWYSRSVDTITAERTERQAQFLQAAKIVQLPPPPSALTMRHRVDDAPAELPAPAKPMRRKKGQGTAS